MPFKSPAAALLVVSTLLAGCGSAPAPTLPARDAPAVRGNPPGRSPTPDTGAALVAPPPPALVVDGRRVSGTVGSYAWVGGTDSAPWLPAGALRAVVVEPGVELVVEMSADIDVESWVARIAAADDDGSSASALGSGSGWPTLTAPPRGDWVVAVQTFFSGGGDAVWYWHLVVR